MPNFTREQQRNFKLVDKYARQYGANSREVKQLQALAWSETRMRNIGEGGSASASKAKTGSVGRGIFQYTSPSLRKAHNVTNSWSILQSTRGALQGLRENRRYWAKRGVKVGSREMSEHIWASWNAGTGRADRALKHFSTTRHHVQRAGKFMTAIGGKGYQGQGGYGGSGNYGINAGGFGGNQSGFMQVGAFDANSALGNQNFDYAQNRVGGGALGGQNFDYAQSAQGGGALGNQNFDYQQANQLPMFAQLQAPQQQAVDLNSGGVGGGGFATGAQGAQQGAQRIRVNSAITERDLYT